MAHSIKSSWGKLNINCIKRQCLYLSLWIRAWWSCFVMQVRLCGLWWYTPVLPLTSQIIKHRDVALDRGTSLHSHWLSHPVKLLSHSIPRHHSLQLSVILQMLWPIQAHLGWWRSRWRNKVSCPVITVKDVFSQVKLVHRFSLQHTMAVCEQKVVSFWSRGSHSGVLVYTGIFTAFQKHLRPHYTTKNTSHAHWHLH